MCFFCQEPQITSVLKKKEKKRNMKVRICGVFKLWPILPIMSMMTLEITNQTKYNVDFH